MFRDIHRRKVFPRSVKYTNKHYNSRLQIHRNYHNILGKFYHVSVLSYVLHYLLTVTMTNQTLVIDVSFPSIPFLSHVQTQAHTSTHTRRKQEPLKED